MNVKNIRHNHKLSLEPQITFIINLIMKLISILKHKEFIYYENIQVYNCVSKCKRNQRAVYRTERYIFIKSMYEYLLLSNDQNPLWPKIEFFLLFNFYY